jgi:S-(hydroxymethyl)glutathione dehydrogenase/alcohol dehydrogenase
MQVRAAVAWEAGKPLQIETVDLEGPQEGEVLVEIRATGICHTDKYTLSGADPEGLFPSILGHEGAGVVADTGPGVKTSERRPRHSRCTRRNAGSANPCLSRKTNLLYGDPRHARKGPDARRHQPLPRRTVSPFSITRAARRSRITR